MHFKVDRSKWRRGHTKMRMETAGPPCLLNEEGNSCCLGFCALQLGLSPSEIFYVAYPNGIGHPLKDFNQPGELPGSWLNTLLSVGAAGLNENCELTEAEREKKLKALFRQHGHTISFHGRTPREFWAKRGKKNG